MTSPWMQTRFGHRVDIIDPEPEQIRLADIGYHLGRINRYTGATTRPWTVAQHSALVEMLLPRDACPLTRVWAVAHDFHEGVIGDITSPVKRAIRQLCAGYDVIDDIADRIDYAIRRRFGLPIDLPKHVEAAVKLADMTALAVEKAHLMVEEPEPWCAMPPVPAGADRLFVYASGFDGAGVASLFSDRLRAYRGSVA